jgi:hypothetical protein
MSARDGYQPGVPCWVAAVGSGRGGEAPAVPAWGTHIWVDSADPQGAVFSVSRSPVPTPSSSRPGG